MGQVFKGNNENDVCDGLYVIDGSNNPNSIGSKPFTYNISIAPFRIAKKLPGHKKYWPK